MPRMQPATFVTRKEFLPIVDSDGLVKPVCCLYLGFKYWFGLPPVSHFQALFMQLEELDRAGVERIILIVREGDEEELRKRFEIPQGIPMKDAMRLYMNKIHALAKKIIYVEQRTQEGFGHAVLQARK